MIKIRDVWDDVHSVIDNLLDHPELWPQNEAEASILLGWLCQKRQQMEDIIDENNKKLRQAR